jgi:myo-inositol-1(or 4)-monophosphatase
MIQETLPTPASELLAVALRAGQEAAHIVRSFRTDNTVTISLKGARNLVTSADLASEKIIKEIITERFPTHAILAEESDQEEHLASYGKGFTWVIDPIDGTTNYARGHVHVGISIACAFNGQVVVGVVITPFLEETFTAIRGQGAFCNGKSIVVSPTTTLEETLVCTGFPYDRANVNNITGRLNRVLSICQDVRRPGAASVDLCWVACGRLDAYYEESLSPWDGAAGSLIAREAGATIGHVPYDSPTQRGTAAYPGELCVDNLVVTTPAVFEPFMRLLQD